jgi:hypothetical protein
MDVSFDFSCLSQLRITLIEYSPIPTALRNTSRQPAILTSPPRPTNSPYPPIAFSHPHPLPSPSLLTSGLAPSTASPRASKRDDTSNAQLGVPAVWPSTGPAEQFKNVACASGRSHSQTPRKKSLKLHCVTQCEAPPFCPFWLVPLEPWRWTRGHWAMRLRSTWRPPRSGASRMPFWAETRSVSPTSLPARCSGGRPVSLHGGACVCAQRANSVLQIVYVHRQRDNSLTQAVRWGCYDAMIRPRRGSSTG